ncbi:toll/interleukin-1 receptor domain-containing protein [Mycobacterium sp.]|uniref:toll/interleukin-1 receptor domain-containing protein n=1 Tax=Mycobacterium sp. TaxID=1785 RepID=UPI002CB94C24|nr:toll/interleukin-1 receptor domain-containing protein [Mycobacterium sp.]HTY31281.1 toll/interleukin-1 receptor domain-containing protein [Mycobacterium sp.]
MYFAQYDVGGTVFSVGAAAVAPRHNAPLFGPRWIAALIERAECDHALRLRFRPHGLEVTLLINTPHPTAINSSLTTLAGGGGPVDRIRLISNSRDFDELVGDSPEYQAWLNHDGYSVGGHSVAADFRLLPLLERLITVLDSRPYDFTYQVNLRRYTPTADDRRSARKFKSALRLDSPFPQHMTDLQSAIADRLLEPGFESDEFLASPDSDTFGLLMAEAERHFSSTMGPFGFTSPPVETGRFDDLLLSGLHSSSFEERAGLLSRAAALWSTEDVRRLLSSPAPTPLAPALRLDSGSKEPPVFLSYSSSDFLQAMATARHLETCGIGCWIAPRNIGAGESYPDAIMNGINNCKVLVALVSGSSNVSPHVHREIERALHRNVVIIPLRIENVLPTHSMEYLLATCQWIDALDPEFDEALDKLTRRIEQLVGAGNS